MAVQVHQAGLMDLVPFRTWALEAYGHLIARLDSMDDDAASRPPAPGVPSALEVLCHLVPLRRRIARICISLEHGALPAAEHRTIAKLPSMTWARMALDASQDELRDVLDSLWPMTDLELRAEGYGAGPYNVKEWLAWQRLHDDEHLAEIEHAAYLLGVHGAKPLVA